MSEQTVSPDLDEFPPPPPEDGDDAGAVPAEDGLTDDGLPLSDGPTGEDDQAAAEMASAAEDDNDLGFPGGQLLASVGNAVMLLVVGLWTVLGAVVLALVGGGVALAAWKRHRAKGGSRAGSGRRGGSAGRSTRLGSGTGGGRGRGGAGSGSGKRGGSASRSAGRNGRKSGSGKPGSGGSGTGRKGGPLSRLFGRKSDGGAAKSGGKSGRGSGKPGSGSGKSGSGNGSKSNRGRLGRAWDRVRGKGKNKDSEGKKTGRGKDGKKTGKTGGQQGKDGADRKSGDQPETPTTPVPEPIPATVPLPDPDSERAGEPGAPTPGGIDVYGKQFTDAAAQLLAAARQYEPESMYELGDDLALIPNAMRDIAESINVLTQKAESPEWPVHPQFAEVLRGFHQSISRPINTAEEILPQFRRIHPADYERQEAPRGDEKKWNL